MQIIIVGLGKVGSTLAEQLALENHNVTVIDVHSSLIEDFSSRHDVMGIVGNGASYNTLKEAGIETADVLIAVTETDELNLLCCLIAKRAGKCSTIARVRNPVYDSERQFLKDELGLSLIVNPELSASVEIARLLRVPSAIDIDTFAKGRVELLSFKIEKNSMLEGLKLLDLKRATGIDVLVCAVVRGEEVFIPSGDFMLLVGDEISITAAPRIALDFFERIGIETDQVKDTVIAGGGGIGYYLARQLLHMGISVKIIERNLERCEELCELLPKATIIHGDAVDRELLLEEGIPSAGSFISLTNIDEENIMLSLYVKNASGGKTKTVTKINRIAFDEVIESLDLGSVIIPKNTMTEVILQYVRALHNSVGSNVETLYKIVGGRAEALEFSISEGCELIGITLLEMDIKENVLIGCINRGGQVIIPRGPDSFQKGDTVIVVTTIKGLDNIVDILK